MSKKTKIFKNQKIYNFLLVFSSLLLLFLLTYAVKKGFSKKVDDVQSSNTNTYLHIRQTVYSNDGKKGYIRDCPVEKSGINFQVCTNWSSAISLENILGNGGESYSSFAAFTFIKNGVPTVRQTILNGKDVVHNSVVYRSGQLAYRRDCPIDLNKGIDFEKCEKWSPPTPLNNLIPDKGNNQIFDSTTSFVYSKLNSQNIRESYLRQSFIYENGTKSRARDCLMERSGPNFDKCTWQAEVNLSNIRGIGGESYVGFSSKMIPSISGSDSYLRQVLVPKNSNGNLYVRNCPTDSKTGINFNQCSRWQTETIKLPNNETNYRAYEETLFETNYLINPQNNVVVFMLDDLDSGTFQKAIELGLLPNIKRYILDRGINFVNAFATDSVCCPSRATFLTGQYSHNHGVLSNEKHNGSVEKFNDQSTIATWLQNRNYKTALIGKYLNGYGVFDSNKDGVFDNRDRTYIPRGWTKWYGLLDWNVYKMYGYEVNEDGFVSFPYGNSTEKPSLKPEEKYQTNVLTNKAVEFIRLNAKNSINQRRNQIFLYLTPTTPHVEVLRNFNSENYSSLWSLSIRPDPQNENRSINIGTLPYNNKCFTPNECSFNESDVSDKPLWIRRLNMLNQNDINNLNKQFRERILSLIAIDNMVKKVSEELISQQVYNNTVIIFVSDNGFLNGEHRLSNKMVAYDEATRIPLIIVPAGGTSSRNVRNIVLMNDLAPTIAELAGAIPDITIDGRSLMPLITNQQTISWRKKFFIEHRPLAVSGPNSSENPRYYDVPEYYAIRKLTESESYLYILYPEAYFGRSIYQSEYEYYNLLNDPYALRSLTLSSNNKSQLDNLIERFKRCRGDECRNLEN